MRADRSVGPRFPRFPLPAEAGPGNHRPSSVEATTRRAICRIDAVIPPRGTSRGTGTLIEQDLVLTAFHVVGDRTARPVRFHEDVQLTFPGFTRTGTVVAGAYDTGLDFALLRLDQPAPAEVTPLSLRELEEGDEHVFRSFGFPAAFQEGLAISGTVEMTETTYEGNPTLQLFSIQASAGVGMQVEGLSGGPCLVDGEVVGVIRSSLQRAADGRNVNVGGTLFACAARHIFATTDMVRPSVRARDPLALSTDLPANPFRYLAPYLPRDAEIFFGRRDEIRRLVAFVKSPGTSPICLLRGPTGVGKTSLLSAGLIPRVESHHHVLSHSRAIEGDLPATLRGAFKLGPDARDEDVRTAWTELEASEGKPVLLILDQLEEAYTRSGARGDAELAELACTVRSVFQDRAARPKGRLLLSFRKEWVDDIERAIEPFGLPYTREYVAPLDRTGILETIVGLRRTARLRRHFKVDFPRELPGLVADELLRDRESPVAPVLQILLTRMWEEATKASKTGRVSFDVPLFERLRDEGFGLPAFVQRQIDALPGEQQPHVKSGLVWDILEAHTTPLGTSQTVSRAVFEARYSHVLTPATALVNELQRLFLLGEAQAQATTSPQSPTTPTKNAAQPETATQPTTGGGRATRLLHDTLGPIVRERFATSDAPGPIARTLLETRGRGWESAVTGERLSRADLARVNRGLAGMRTLTPGEKRLLRASLNSRRLVYGAAFVGVMGTLVLVGALAKERIDRQKKEQEAQETNATLKATRGADEARREFDLAIQTPDPVEAVVHLCRAVEAAPESDKLLPIYIHKTIHAFLEAPVVSFRLEQTPISHADVDEAASVIAFRQEGKALHLQHIDLSDPVAGGSAERAVPVTLGAGEEIADAAFAWSPGGQALAAVLYKGSDSTVAVIDARKATVVEQAPLDWLEKLRDHQAHKVLYLHPRSNGTLEAASGMLMKHGFRVASGNDVLDRRIPPSPYVATNFREHEAVTVAGAGITRGGRIDRYASASLPRRETGLAEVRFANLSPTADRLSLTGAGKARVLSTLRPPHTLWAGDAPGISEAAVAPDGDRFAVASYEARSDRTEVRVLTIGGGTIAAATIEGRARWLTWTTDTPSRLLWAVSAMDGTRCWLGLYRWIPGTKDEPRLDRRLSMMMPASLRAERDGWCEEVHCGGTSPGQSDVVPTPTGFCLWPGIDLHLESIDSGLSRSTIHFHSYDRMARVAARALLQAPVLSISEGAPIAKSPISPPFEIHSWQGYGEVLLGARREPVARGRENDFDFCLPRLDPTGMLAAWWGDEKLTITVLSTGTRLADVHLQGIVEYGFIEGGRELLIVTKDGNIRTSFVQEPSTKKPAWLPLLGRLVAGAYIAEGGNRVDVPGMLHGVERRKAFDTICQAAKAGDRGAAQVVRHVNAARKKGPYCDLPD